MAAEGFWNDQKAAQEIISESNKLKRVVNGLTEFKAKFEDSKAMEELLEEEGVDENSEEAVELQQSAELLKVALDEFYGYTSYRYGCTHRSNIGNDVGRCYNHFICGTYL